MMLLLRRLGTLLLICFMCAQNSAPVFYKLLCHPPLPFFFFFCFFRLDQNGKMWLLNVSGAISSHSFCFTLILRDPQSLTKTHQDRPPCVLGTKPKYMVRARVRQSFNHAKPWHYFFENVLFTYNSQEALAMTSNNVTDKRSASLSLLGLKGRVINCLV